MMWSARSVLVAWLVLFVGIGVAFGAPTDPERRGCYDPEANAEEQLATALKKAKASGRFVLVQIGGDWCPWCVRLNQTICSDSKLLTALERRMEWVHVYYGRDKKNEAVMQRLGDPTHLGFPVFVLVWPTDRMRYLHIPTASFEEGKGYNKEKLFQFFDRFLLPNSEVPK